MIKIPNHDCMIIANPEGRAWDSAVSIHKYIQEKDESKKFNGSKYYLNELKVKRFRDGEIKVKIKENIRRKNCFFIHDSSLPPNEWLMELIFVNEAMHNSSADEIIDVLPYMKFARQDRKDESRVSINSKAIADILGLYANRILTIDAHFTQIQGFYKIPLDNLYSANVLHNHLKKKHPEFLEDVVVMSPDTGGTSRAKAFANKLGIRDIVIGYKHRPEAGVIDEFRIIGDVKGRNVLIIDDIVDSGNTLVIASDKLKKEGAKSVYAYCTHGIFSENAIEKIEKGLDLMITTDTIPLPNNPSIETFSVSEFFGEAIYRTNKGDSLSALFD